MKYNWLFSFFLLSFGANSQAANIHEALINCSQIKPNNKRLICFDQTMLKYQKKLKTTQSTEANIKVVKKNTTNADDLFGKASDSSKPKSITSHVKGTFKGWIKNSLIHLDNGQVWKVVSRSKGYAKLKSPKVTISQGILGSFDIKVEGLKSKAKVRRVK